METSVLDNNEDEHERVAAQCIKVRNSKSYNYCFSCNSAMAPVPKAWERVW